MPSTRSRTRFPTWPRMMGAPPAVVRLLDEHARRGLQRLGRRAGRPLVHLAPPNDAGGSRALKKHLRAPPGGHDRLHRDLAFERPFLVVRRRRRRRYAAVRTGRRAGVRGVGVRVPGIHEDCGDRQRSEDHDGSMAGRGVRAHAHARYIRHSGPDGSGPIGLRVWPRPSPARPLCRRADHHATSPGPGSAGRSRGSSNIHRAPIAVRPLLTERLGVVHGACLTRPFRSPTGDPS